MFWVQTNASKSNSQRFQETTLSYLGNIATALSLSLGQKEKQLVWTPIGLSDSLISISAVLSNPKEWQKRLIGGNMKMIESYKNVLETNIVALLDGTTNRSDVLDEHISLLRNYGQDTTEQLITLDDQIAELTAIIAENNSKTQSAKGTLDSSYVWLYYSGVDEAIDTYALSSTAGTKAHIYKTYLEKFRKSYVALQIKNKKLIEILSNNREALIKWTTITIPASWSDILKELKLIETEQERIIRTTNNQ